MGRSYCFYCAQGKCLKLCKAPESGEAQHKLRQNIKITFETIKEKANDGRTLKLLKKRAKSSIKLLKPDKQKKLNKKLKKLFKK